MANRKNTHDASKDQPRQKIIDDTQLFLAAGGKITAVPTGLSGIERPESGPKHIKLGKET